jgi:hypothetical protein
LLGHVPGGSTHPGGGHHLHSTGVSSGDLGLEGGPSSLLSLSDGDKERLGPDHLAVHVGDGLLSLVGGRETDETEPSRGARLVITHDLARGDGPESVKLGTETVIIPVVCGARSSISRSASDPIIHGTLSPLLTVDVLDIQIDTLILTLLLHPSGLVSPPQLFVPLAPLLSPTDEQLLVLEIGIVQLVHRPFGIVVVFIVYKPESLVLACLVKLEGAGDDGSKRFEEGVEFVLSGL